MFRFACPRCGKQLSAPDDSPAQTSLVRRVARRSRCRFPRWCQPVLPRLRGKSLTVRHSSGIRRNITLNVTHRACRPDDRSQNEPAA